MNIDIRVHKFEQWTKFPGILCAPTDQYVNFNNVKNLPTHSFNSVYYVECTHTLYTLY